jgi:hypothetical protein
VLSFGPLVRSRIQDKAERYGAVVDVQHVVPGWRGLSLRGVEVTIAEMPGVHVWLDEVVVDWDRKPISTSGGKVVAVGSMTTLISNFEAWKEAHLKGGGGGGSSRKLAIEGFAVEWKSAPSGATQAVTASGVSASKEGPQVRAAAATVFATYGKAKLEVEGGAIELTRGDHGYRLASLTTKGLSLAYDLGERPTLGAAAPTGSGLPPALVGSTAAPAPTQAPSADKQEDVAAAAGVVHPRVANARRARESAIALATRLDRVLGADAKIELAGARAKLGFGDELLNLGPGTLSLSRTDGDLIVDLAPTAAPPETAASPEAVAGTTAKPLTFSARVPYAAGKGNEAPETRAMRVGVQGGPVWLSMLGVHEGDLGLRNVGETRIEADVEVVLPPGEQTLSVDGRGRVQNLSIADERLAKAPLEGVELAWRSKLDMRLDGSLLTLHDAEVDLGDIRFLLKGTWERSGGEHKVAVDYSVPLMTCERAFSSIPEALVPKLVGMHFAGSLSLKGHARFDTANIKKDYDVDWDGTLSCRITHAPAAVAVTRFKNSFTKLVYTPKSEERNMTFGPNEKTWVALPSIAHFMSGSVLVTEDGGFYRHRGFDQEAIVNSIQQNIEARRFVRGASTISMQLAKNLYLPRAKTLSRKLQEAVLTMYLEQELTKREMMELYLNVIEYGPMVYGIGPAARHYFNSHPSRLSVSQSMYLASILRNPKKQFFGAGGAVIDSHMRTLRLYIKVLEKIRRITEDELERGLRETVIFGSPAPMVAPVEDEDGYPLDEEPPTKRGDLNAGEPGPTHEANTGL